LTKISLSNRFDICLARRKKIKGEKRFQPAQFLAISFIITILAGSGLLLLPLATRSGHISFVDALFTSTSGVCVTGLIVQDTATFFTPIGQIIILVLIQLGGLGIMTFSTLILLAAGKRISIKDRIIVQQDFHHTAPRDIKSIITRVFLYTLILEGIGAFSLFFRWLREYSWLESICKAVFHSVSAFCNAGFSLFSGSFLSFRGDIWINLTIMLLIILGGVGFLVLDEVRNIFFRLIKRKKIKVSLHTELVMIITAVLILLPSLIFLAVEWNQALAGFSLKDKVFSSFFQIVTPRTAGFNTLNLNLLSLPIIFLLIMLMFIGASPGSTGGGVKTCTIGVIFAYLKSKITARESVNVFYRTIPVELVTKAFTVVTLAILIIFLSSFLLFLTQPGLAMKEILFEVFSAFGTVGLSLGITPRLNDFGKIIIIFTMYIGRIGPLTLLYAFSREKSYGRFEYAEETVMIG